MTEEECRRLEEAHESCGRAAETGDPDLYYAENAKFHEVMDRPYALGTFCPEPVIRTQNAARELAPGQIAMILADDAGVEIDLPAWCISTRNEYLGVLREPDQLRVFVRKLGN